MKRLTNRFFLILASGLVLLSCSKKTTGTDSPDEPDDPNIEETDKPGEPIHVVDGKVKFYLKFKEGGVCDASGAVFKPGNGQTVTVGGKEYPVEKDENGNYFIEATANQTATYNASMLVPGAEKYTGSSAYTSLILPPGQFLDSFTEDVATLPQFASYDSSNGNILYLSPGCGALALTLAGAEDIVSVNVSAADGALLSGVGNYMVSRKANVMSKGFSWANLNCTAASGSKFIVLVAAGDYPSGLDVTVTDKKHRVQRIHVSNTAIASDEVVACNADWAPDGEVIFYDGFDNFVWGGDIVAGSKGAGFAVTGKDTGTEADATLRGYEKALVAVPYTQPGSGFIQSTSFMDVAGKTVEQSHKMSTAYVVSRNIGDYRFLYRCQEHPGYIAVGTGDDSRGIWQTVPMGVIGGLSDLTLSFDFVLSPGIKDMPQVQIVDGGYIESVSIDGQLLDKLGAGSAYVAVTHTCNFETAAYATGSIAGGKRWHRAELSIRNANDATYFRISTADEGKGTHGFWLDNVEIRKTKDRSVRDNGTFRVMYWNIQDGMWADQYNNYSNFVEWIKRYSPDVCVWCEARSIFNASGTNLSKAEKASMLTNAWPSLYPKYNHGYYALGGDRNNYPQAITSRYSITTLKRITDTDEKGRPVVSGAGLFRITVAGEDIYIVTLHPYAQSYAFDVPSSEREASTAAHGGDYYREHEVKYVISQTRNNPEFANVKNWIMMGDFNSKSPNDEHYYKLGTGSTQYLAQKQILETTDYHDIIAEQYPGAFMTSVCSATSRIDYMFASPQMYERVANAVILTDSWANPYQVENVTGYLCFPSDHRPVLVDFRMK